jgi:Fur family transcriptional regulator, ferric uptake regulator
MERLPFVGHDDVMRPEDLVDEVTLLLRSRGERMTTPRLAVLAVLARRTGHLSAEEIVAAVAEDEPSVHRASVYRALETLTNVEVVAHVHLGHGGTAYHLATPHQSAHLHGQCDQCGRVIDLPGDALEVASADISRRTGFQLDPRHVALSGRCAECAPSAH